MSEVILVYSLVAFIIGFIGIRKSRYNAFGGNFFLNIVGAFVWADAAIFGIFWGVLSLILALLDQTTLFLLFLSIFWIVRSLGEILYWMHEQFTVNKRNHTLPWSQFFQDDSILFVYQIFWQCIMVISILLTIYFAHKWLQTI